MTVMCFFFTYFAPNYTDQHYFKNLNFHVDEKPIFLPPKKMKNEKQKTLLISVSAEA